MRPFFEQCSINCGHFFEQCSIQNTPKQLVFSSLLDSRTFGWLVIHVIVKNASNIYYPVYEVN
ncbi:MAG: hypothetical protein D6694_08690 [Gammaproteobacteria bacterium]|nr:MAG: hypothetical protein D6694_08690 [Gammaproteobacteria bacterium]